MDKCFQGGLTMRQHGEAVWQNTRKLILGYFDGFKLPKWFLEEHKFIVNNLHDWNTIKTYNQYHDAGKFSCRIVDADNREHFPDHEFYSKMIFLDVYPEEHLIAELIGLDMIMHTEKYEQIMERNLPAKTLMTLLITAFAEIHANAELFGGIESTNFKIKYKRLDKLGKKLIQYIGKHVEKHSYIIVRKDLPVPQYTVQGGHAIWEQAKGQSQHPSFVVLGVENEFALQQAMAYLIDNNVQFKIFREPMEPYNNSITAIATEPLEGERRQLLRHFQLLKI